MLAPAAPDTPGRLLTGARQFDDGGRDAQQRQGARHHQQAHRGDRARVPPA
ncbi:hypothetical protein ACWDF9_18105 [Streptomyces rubiginosohelvolus]